MAAKSIGTLRAQLILDTEKFLGGFAKAQTATKSFSSSFIGGIGSKIGGVVAGIATVGTVMHSLAAGLEQVDRQAALADRLGITVGEVQKLSLAAKLGETDVETLANAMLKMGKNIGSGGGSLFNRLLQVADSMAKIKDTGERAKKAQDIFGKGGFEILNLLIQGGRGIRSSADAIDNFGLAISRVDAAKVEALNDTWDTLKTVLGGLRNQIVTDIAPAVTNFMQDWLRGLELLVKGYNDIGAKQAEIADSNTFLDYVGAILGMGVAIEGLNVSQTLEGLREMRKDAAKAAAMSGRVGGSALLGKSVMGKGVGGNNLFANPLEKGSLGAATAVLHAGGSVVDKIELNTKKTAEATARMAGGTGRGSVSVRAAKLGGGKL